MNKRVSVHMSVPLNYGGMVFGGTIGSYIGMVLSRDM
jgi:hypothetical protein